MKIIELEIYNMRGIRDILLTPKQQNLVVWGPNGSGKSGVVDAVDFLLTGKITRLTGEGSQGVSLRKHGPHIDCKPEEAIVRAKIQLPNLSEPIEIKRCMGNPSKLECDKSILLHLEPIIELAKQGQHVLTRREILRYITSEGGSRAQQIQSLLNISEVEDIRKSLVKVQNDFNKELKSAKINLDKAKSTIGATIQKASFSDEVLLSVINTSRAIFGASPLTHSISSELKNGIKLPTAIRNERPVNTTSFQNYVDNLKVVLLDNNQDEIAAYDEQLQFALETLKLNSDLQKAVSQQQLVILGKKLVVEDDTICPLCDTPWSNGELGKHLNSKLAHLQTAEKYQSQIQNLSAKLKEKINFILLSISKIIPVTETIGLELELQTLKEWETSLSSLFSALSPATEKYLELPFTPESIRSLFAPLNLLKISDKILNTVRSKFPEATPEQNAWDLLTKLQENLKVLESAESELHVASCLYQRSVILLDKFEQARDSTLENLYNEIRTKFENLYKEIHGSDESDFEARLEPSGASLDLEVSFYGRGKHPPHALHSEGHQDSMGLCLYLALAENLTKGLIELVILDDVVMSVDSEHRRELCKLLTKNFPHRQFFITTHDKTWATQLKTEKVVNSKGSIEFSNWSVDTGPQIGNEFGLWEKIEKDLANNDIPSAAAKLRRGSEQFFSEVCDALHASVRYKLNGRLELGDLMPAAISKYKEHLKSAKKAAQSWGNQEAIKSLSETDIRLGQINARTNSENWAVNASVHYNNWANLGEKDFRPVLEAFQDLHSAFTCSSCDGILYITTVGVDLDSLKCGCGEVNWSLKPKRTFEKGHG
jgi:DNA repair exonuclease SbcCD ATPase subunit